MTYAWRIFFAVLGISLLAGCAREETEAQGPIVLAAASLQEVLEASADAWEAEGHPRPVLSFAGTAALARQVEAGAGGDLFVSADEIWMGQLQADGLLVAGSRQRLAGNRLALIAPAGSTTTSEIGPGMDIVAAMQGGRLAMAEPDSVPAGRYARESLQALGQWNAVKERLAIGESVRVALQIVSRAEAPLGIVYRTDALAEPNVRIVGLFPASSHSPISYPVARLLASENPEAEAFEAFLLSARGQAIFARYGFLPG